MAMLAFERSRRLHKKIIRLLGFTKEDDLHFYHYGQGRPADTIPALQRALKQLKPSLVIVDTFFKFTGIDVMDS